MKFTYALFTFILIALGSCKSSKYADLADGIYADIQTSQGDIIVKLEHEKTPITVANFVSLAEGNNPFVSDEYKDKKYAKKNFIAEIGKERQFTKTHTHVSGKAKSRLCSKSY